MAFVFVAGFLTDQTINRITLFALILSLGLLVDSATVVVENIFRHFKNSKGNNRHESIIQGVNEVGIGLFLSTLTSVIVFLPTAYISGMMGDYMGPLSFFIPAALIFSLLIAFVITPLLADLLLPQSAQDLAPDSGKFFMKVSALYEKFLHNILSNKKFKKRFLRLVFGGLFLVFLLPALALVHFKMLPSADKNQFFVYIDTTENTDIPQTHDISKKVSKILLQNPLVQSVQSFSGTAPILDFNGLFKGAQYRNQSHQSTLRVNLIDKDLRRQKSTPLLNQLRTQVLQAPDLAPIWGRVKIKFLEDPPGPPVQSTLMAKVKGPDRMVLENVALDIEKMFHKTKQVVDIDTSIENPSRKVVFEVNHQKALASGVTAQQILQTLQIGAGTIQASQFHSTQTEEMAFVELRFSSEKRNELADLNELFIKNHFGDMVPLLSVVKKINTRTDPILKLDEREKVVFVTAELENRSVVYANLELIKKMLSYEFPQGAKLESWNLFRLHFVTEKGESYQVEWGGEWKMTLENFRDLGLAMIAAFALIYLVLVAQFQSFKIPRLILSTVPLALLGILPGFFLLDIGFGIFLTATSLIGFIALMGIVVNNAIIYLEYFQILSKKMAHKQALLESGKTRLRPILLTSMTTILGNLTIVTDPVWSGLAWAVVFGLSMSALFTLGVFPALMDEDR